MDMKKFDAIIRDKDTIAALLQCKSKQEALDVLKAKGVIATDEELKALMEEIIKAVTANEDSMNVDDMDAVAGGAGAGIREDTLEDTRVVIRETVGLGFVTDFFKIGAHYVGVGLDKGANWLIDKVGGWFD